MSTTKEIKDRIYAAIVAELQALDPDFVSDPLKKSVENAISIALAPEFKLNEIFIKNAARQGNPLQADSVQDSEIGSLEAWGNIKINRPPDPATGGTYNVLVTGTGTIPAGTQYVNQETGFVYLVQANTPIVVSGTVEVKSVGTGSEVGLEVGEELFSQQTITGIDNPGVVSSEITAPVDGETIEEYREDILQSFRITPRGGTRGDYVVWADAVAGVRKGFPYTGGNLNQITVYVQSILDPQGTTPQAILDDVQTYIETQQPMTAGGLNVTSTVPKAYDVEITSISEAGLETTIENAVDIYFAGKEPFLAGVDNESERIDRIINSELFVAVQNAILPATFQNLQIKYNAADVNFETLDYGTIPKTGVISYV